ncbi:MAG: sulfatase activating formylglycine-generating enzyme [Mariniblastus sp.]|jgi:formylglycine-generating enzyme required for sulfatase activity
MYCNWLSRKEGLQSCYERTGKIHKFPYAERFNEDWRLIPERNGYRLPTNAEWELACRGSPTTDYSFGNDTRFLARYAVHKKVRPEPCGSQMPNEWGLFDMHGNAEELCNDWVRDFCSDMESKTDPLGPSKPVYLSTRYPDSLPVDGRNSRHWRKIRCGGYFGEVVLNKASFQHSDIPINSELPDTGFRAVRNLE